MLFQGIKAVPNFWGYIVGTTVKFQHCPKVTAAAPLIVRDTTAVPCTEGEDYVENALKDILRWDRFYNEIA